MVIEAVQWTGQNRQEVLDFTGLTDKKGGMIFWRDTPEGGEIIVRTLEGDLTAMPGDWVIRGTAGEVYPCKPGIFADIYERVP